MDTKKAYPDNSNTNNYNNQQPQYASGYPTNQQPQYASGYPTAPVPVQNLPGYTPAQTYPGYLPPQPPVVVITSSGSWYERNQRNKPQSNSVGAAALIFMTGGMNMAWGFIYSSYSSVFDLHVQVSWFVGAIIGAIIGAALTNLIKKKLLMLVSSFMVVLSGILFTSLDTNVDAIIAARYIIGFGNGLIFIPAIVMVGEEAVKSFRGMIASSIEAMSFSLGIYLELIYSASWNWDPRDTGFSQIQLHGCLCIFFGLIAAIIAAFLVVESPIFFLVRGEEQNALDSIRRLQRPFVLTFESYEQFEEHKRYIAENKEMSCQQSATAGLGPLMKLCFYRILVGMSFSKFTYYGFVLAVVRAYGPNAVWPLIIFGTTRYFGVLIGTFCLDNVGRKKTMLLGALITGGMAIGAGAIMSSLQNYFFSPSKMETVVFLVFVLQFFAGLFASASSPYLSEAFPLAVKPYYIAIAFIAEMLVQIIISACDVTINYNSNGISDYFYTSAALFLAFFVFALLCLPETKLTTLREAQHKFRGFMARGF